MRERGIEGEERERRGREGDREMRGREGEGEGERERERERKRARERDWENIIIGEAHCLCLVTAGTHHHVVVHDVTVNE